MERSLILLAGTPGSGKSTLGKSLARELTPTRLTEHLSTGDTVRAIASRAMDSVYTDAAYYHLASSEPGTLIDNDIIYGILGEALTRNTTKHAGLVLLDGYPRTEEQVDDVLHLAGMDNRALKGVIVTQTSQTIAAARLSQRDARQFELKPSPAEAMARIEQDSQRLNAALFAVARRKLPILKIDSSGQKSSTTAQGIAAVRALLAK